MQWLWLAPLLLAAVRGQCGAGCLMCTSNNICVFCDPQKYVLSGIACKAAAVANCTVWSQAGQCLTCAQSFYVDLTSGQCVSVPSTNVIANCASYASAASCSFCQTGYLLSAGACLQTNTTVNGCMIQNPTNPSSCLKCQPSFLLDPGSGTCVATPTVAGCAGFSLASCTTCNAGYFLNLNLYQSVVFSQSQVSVTLQYMTLDIQDVADQGLFPTCQLVTALNCLTYASASTCATCPLNYYLDKSSSCQPFPNSVIMNCTVYASATVCAQCANGFYLAGPQTCSLANSTSTCLTFDPTASSLICVKCQPAFYLDPNKVCKPRAASTSIQFCTTTDPNADQCLTCQTGYAITSDFLACLPAVPNCKSYASSTKTSAALTCTGCTSGLYYDPGTTSCVLGAVVNCDVYSGTTCQTCQNGYFLSNGLCTAQPGMPNCQTYDQTTLGVCTTCSPNAYKFATQNFCTAVTAIPNCSVYATATTCATCALGFYVDQTQKCTAISVPNNCLSLSNGNCLQCSPQYYLSSGTCVQPPPYFGQNCAVNSATGTTLLTSMACQSCTQGAVPFNFVNSFVCISQATIPTVQSVSNCAKYSLSGNTYSCVGCLPSFYLQPDGSCANSCASTAAMKTIRAFTQGSPYSAFTVSNSRVCVATPPIANCAILAPLIFAQNSANAAEISYTCLTCQSTFYPVIAPTEVTCLNPAVPEIVPSSPVAAYPGVTCITGSTLVRTGATTVAINYCQYYYSVSGNYGCYQCAFGLSGPVLAFPSSTTVGFISACTAIPNCQTNFMDGHTLTLTQASKYKTSLGSLFSCHVCTSPMIPFLALNFASVATIPSLGVYSASSSPFNTGSGGSATACINPVPASFGISAANWNFPANCALGVINTASVANAATSTSASPVSGQSAVFCVACSPKYAPTYATSDAAAPMLVTSCTAIPSCLSSTWFNTCSQCFTNYAYRFSPSLQSVDFTVCVLSPDPGNKCFAVDDAVAPSTCKYCVVGYALNYDGICEQITPYMCSDSGMNFAVSFGVTASSPNFAVGLYLQPNGPGCQSCQTGLSAFLVTTNQMVCSTSPYLASNIFVSGTTFITGCSRYYVKPSLTALMCVVCNSGLVVSTNGKCFSAQSYPNCAQVNDANPASLSCNNCNQGFVLIMGACQTASIKNCLTYGVSTTTAQLCSACVSGYFLSNGLCVSTNVLNCLTPASLTACTACLSGYALLTLSNGQSYCYPIPAALNCAAVDAGFSAGTFTCTSCAANYILTATVPPANVTFCAAVAPIPNCINYNSLSPMLSSTFVCTQCGQGYWLNGAVCTARANSDSACTAYAITSDTCLSCLTGFYPSSDKKSCVLNPTGIAGCLNYSSPTTCTQCGANMYLSNGLCTLVPTAIQVPNCLYYSDSSTCASCVYGYVLVSANNCQASTATNCLTFASANACATCGKNMGLKQQTNGLSCVPITDTNCLQFNPIFPFNCYVCKADYYPANSLCTLVGTAINFCSVYDSSSTCATCNGGYILSVNRTACLRTTTLLARFDVQCSIMMLVSTPVCTKCGPGYYFQNTTCAPCANPGCYSCLSTNTTSCFACNSGYYQNPQGACLPSSDANGTNGTNGTTPVKPSGSAALAVLWSVVLLFMTQLG